GAELTLWDAADFGVPTLGLTYVTTADLRRTHADALTRFLRAALAGIAYAEANPDEAVEIVLTFAGPETDAAHMRFMLDAELADAHSEHGYGWQSAEQWQALADMLKDQAALPADLGVDEAF
ncbi:MAG TPA: ABC transporter substrate-binding protein, partial [Anaerolineales bacterium]|nr:ABC transporter substrate-binding protein [Anaerolineales bacterium]